VPEIICKCEGLGKLREKEDDQEFEKEVIRRIFE